MYIYFVIRSIFIRYNLFSSDIMCERKTNKGTVIYADNVEMEEVENAIGISIQWLISKEQGSNKMHLRRFVMEPGAVMPLHSHSNCEHVQYYLKGRVIVQIEDREYKVGKGDAVFIPVGAAHSYSNIGDGRAAFLCMVPMIDIETTMQD